MAVTIQVYVKTSAFAFEVKPLNLIIEGKNTIRCNRRSFCETHYAITTAITTITFPDYITFSTETVCKTKYFFITFLFVNLYSLEKAVCSVC